MVEKYYYTSEDGFKEVDPSVLFKASQPDSQRIITDSREYYSDETHHEECHFNTKTKAINISDAINYIINEDPKNEWWKIEVYKKWNDKTENKILATYEYKYWVITRNNDLPENIIVEPWFSRYGWWWNMNYHLYVVE